MSRKNAFQKFIIPYLLLIVIIFSPQIIIFSSFIKSLEESQQSRWQELTARKAEQVDFELETIDNTMSQILLDPEFRYAIFTEDNLGLLYEYSQSLPQYHQINESLIDVIIYFFDNELFLRPGLFSLKSISFFQSAIEKNAAQYDQWRRILHKNSGKNRFLPAKKFNVDSLRGTGEILTYVRDFPIGKQNTKGVIFSLISVDNLLSDIYSDYMNNEINYIIYNDSGILASKNAIELKNFEKITGKMANSSVRINGNTFHVFRQKSRLKEIYYLSLIPDSLLLKKTHQQRRFAIYLLSFFLILGGFLSVIFARKSVRPVNRIFSLLDKHKTEAGDQEKEESFEEIFYSVQSLINDNDNLRIDLKQHKQDLTKSFLSQLITGNLADEDAVNHYLDYMNLPMRSRFYLLAVAKLSNFSNNRQEEPTIEELEQKKLVLKAMMEEMFPGHLLIQNLHSEKVIMLFYYADLNLCENVGPALEQLANKLKTHGNSWAQFAIGVPYNSLIDTHFSYRRIINIFNNPVPENVPVFYVESSNFTRQLWIYDLETELKLISLIRMGEKNQVIELLKSIRNDNQDVDRKRMLIFLSELCGTVFRLAYQMLEEESLKSFESKLFGIRQKEHVSDFHLGLQALILYLCDVSEQYKESHNKELRDAVFLYIDNHLSDYSLNLFQVASEFQIAEKYLSRFFKNQVGANFAGYVEDLRMKKAVMLMTDTSYPLSVICKKIGYSNSNTFYKAFKRKFSTSPGNYRDKIQRK